MYTYINRHARTPSKTKTKHTMSLNIIFFHLIHSRWASLPSCLWSLRIFPSLPGSRLTIFYHDASSALFNPWLNFTYSRSHAFRYGRRNTNSGGKNRTHDFRTSRCASYLLDHSGDEGIQINFVTLGLLSDGCQHYYVATLLAIKQITILLD